MQTQESLRRFRQLCADAGLDVNALDPWLTWKVFKTFMREPVDAPLDGASFRCGSTNGEGDQPDVTEFAAFVRVFSDVDAEADDEELFEGIVAEFDFAPESRSVLQAVEVHSHDFSSFAAFVQQVEGLAEFQAVMNRRPIRSELYAQEL